MKLSHTRFMKFSKCMSRSGTLQSGIFFCMLMEMDRKRQERMNFYSIRIFFFLNFRETLSVSYLLPETLKAIIYCV